MMARCAGCLWGCLHSKYGDSTPLFTYDSCRFWPLLRGSVGLPSYPRPATPVLMNPYQIVQVDDSQRFQVYLGRSIMRPLGIKRRRGILFVHLKSYSFWNMSVFVGASAVHESVERRISGCRCTVFGLFLVRLLTIPQDRL